jgi:hypothetical protein
MGERAVGDVQVPLGDGDVHGLAGDAAGEVQRRGQIGQLVEVVQVGQRAVTPLALQVEHEGRAVGRGEDHVAPADPYLALRIAAMQIEFLRVLGDQVHDQRPVEVHSLARNLGAGLFPQRDRLVVPEVDAHFLQDGHGGVVDQLDAFLVQHLVDGNVSLQGGQRNDGAGQALAPPGAAPAAPARSGIARCLCHGFPAPTLAAAR